MGGPPGSDDVKIGKLSICVELCVGDVMTPCRDHDVEYSMIDDVISTSFDVVISMFHQKRSLR